MKLESLKYIAFISLFAVFAACNNSSEKKAGTAGADSVSAAPGLTPESQNAVISARDSAVKDTVQPRSAKKSRQEATISPKTEEPEARKPFKTITGANSRPVIAAKPEKVENPNIKKGAMLISNSDCFACHQIDETMVGPGYKEVAKKYETNSKNIEYLAGKIINGGTGVWGEVYMAPHPSISQEDARAMAEYILSLK